MHQLGHLLCLYVEEILKSIIVWPGVSNCKTGFLSSKIILETVLEFMRNYFYRTFLQIIFRELLSSVKIIELNSKWANFTGNPSWHLFRKFYGTQKLPSFIELRPLSRKNSHFGTSPAIPQMLSREDRQLPCTSYQLWIRTQIYYVWILPILITRHKVVWQMDTLAEICQKLICRKLICWHWR